MVGVLDVADEIQLKTPGGGDRTTRRSPRPSARRRMGRLRSRPEVRSTVTEGFVTLEGEVATLREKEDAQAAIRKLTGVRGVRNRLLVEAVKVDPAKLRKSIEEALERRAEREAERIRVRVEDGTVVLEGRVRTWPEKQAILGCVSHAPGVREVAGTLAVIPGIDVGPRRRIGGAVLRAAGPNEPRRRTGA